MPLLIFALALLFRILPLAWAAADPERLMTPDSRSYWELAEMFSSHGTYGPAENPELFRTPGYPFFLAALAKAGVNSPVGVALIQTVISAASCLLLYGLAKRLLKKLDSQGLVNHQRLTLIPPLAALLLAFSSSSVVAANSILSETLFAFLLLALLWGSESWLDKVRETDTKKISDKNQYWQPAALGLISGSLVLVRTIFLPLQFVIAFYLTLRSGKKISPLIFLIASLILPFTWSMRNYTATGYFGVSTVGEINLYRYYACALKARHENKNFAEMQEIFSAELENAGDQRRQAKFARSEGLDIIRNSPGQYLFVHARGSLNSLLPEFGGLAALFGADVGNAGTLAVIHTEGLRAGVKHYFQGQTGLFIIAMPFLALLLIKYCGCAAAITAILCRHKRFIIILLFHSALIAWMLLAPGPAAHPRFRTPVQPLLCFYAAAGIIIALTKAGIMLPLHTTPAAGAKRFGARVLRTAFPSLARGTNQSCAEHRAPKRAGNDRD